jgi:hypothetical protein
VIVKIVLKSIISNEVERPGWPKNCKPLVAGKVTEDGGLQFLKTSSKEKTLPGTIAPVVRHWIEGEKTPLVCFSILFP